MKKLLEKLSVSIFDIDSAAALKIQKISGRYDKLSLSTPALMQPAFKYIMYLKLMHNLDDQIFHHMKRKYLNTDDLIQQECRQELDKIVNRDALNSSLSSAELRREFAKRLNEYLRVEVGDHQ